MQLSKHFKLEEFTKSMTATRKGIDNSPGAGDIKNLENVCYEILSQKIGSSSKSQHCKGQAADFEIFSEPNNEVSDWIKENLMFDQLILEYYTPGEPNSGWIHVSYTKDINLNRKEYLMAIRVDGKTQYKPILGLSTDRYVK